MSIANDLSDGGRGGVVTKIVGKVYGTPKTRVVDVIRLYNIEGRSFKKVACDFLEREPHGKMWTRIDQRKEDFIKYMNNNYKKAII